MHQESTEQPTTLTLLMRSAHRELMKGVHTMLPGVIESFDPSTQRAKVNLATAQETIEGVKVSFPPLVNVPVQFFRWGGFSISAPVNPGDECCVIFSERSMDLYLSQGGSDRVPNDARFFDLSDAFAIPALNSQANVVPSYDPENLVLKHDSGLVKMTLTPDGKMTVETTGELKMISLDKITATAVDNNKMAAGDGVNSLELTASGQFIATNPTANLLAVLNTLYSLIQVNTVVPTWSVPAQNSYTAEMVKLGTFL